MGWNQSDLIVSDGVAWGTQLLHGLFSSFSLFLVAYEEKKEYDGN